MGFFGFLKKPVVTAPRQPSVVRPLSEVPPPPAPNSAPDIPSETTLFEPAPSPSLLQHEDDFGFPTETPEMPLDSNPIEMQTAYPESPHTDDVAPLNPDMIMSELPTTPKELDDDLDINHSTKRLLDVDLPPMGPMHEEPESWSEEPPNEHELPPMVNHDIPDFTTEEINAAENLELHPEVHKEELPSLEPLPELIEPIESLYVPAVAYRDALTTISGFQKSVHKGDEALDKFTQQITAHGTELSIFAEQLNTMQEELIQMDNVLNER